MFGVPAAKGVVSSPPQPWIRFNDSPTPSESPQANQQYNQLYQTVQVQQQQPYHRQSKVSSLSPSLSDNFSPNDNLNNIPNGIKLANFDFNAASIEKNPKILHPVALRVSPDGQLVTYDSNNGGSSSVPGNNSSSGSSSSNSNDSSSGMCSGNNNGSNSRTGNGGGMINNCGPASSIFLKSLPSSTSHLAQQESSTSQSFQPSTGLTNLPPGVDKKGAFTVYKKFDHSTTIKETTTKESNRWLEILKAKYHPPKPVQMPRSIYELFQNKELVDYIQDLQERCYRLESMNNELIHKVANLMEDQSYHGDYKRLSK
ncbi:signal transducer and activator of transcription B isoform X4 [Tetranychus urticae]|uniref:signal transducer and activator of transcription B isoform X4 n=1 Tax=Tetranychus urticae TaxID=32264 RepID=UPI000D65A8CE|nr:signal transducer and activator of transcription B isoform X4 [Tetranychus urticae]